MGRRRRGVFVLVGALLVGALMVGGCANQMLNGQGVAATTLSTASGGSPSATTTDPTMTETAPTTIADPSVSLPPDSATAEPIPAVPGPFTVAFAGDVHFAGRVGDRLAADQATVFGAAAPGLAAADLTMVNLETAITTADTPADKSFTFKAPPSALPALQLAGIDVATMANNHGADYGETGLDDSLAAIAASGFAVIGIGANAAAAYAPYRTVLHGHPVAIFAASQVLDATLANFTAGPQSPGIASAWSDELLAGVSAAKAVGDLVIVYLHWGTEYESCPNSDQRDLADQLAAAGATAIIGAHAHVLQGAGWRADGVYVAYGLSNFLWWRSRGGAENNNGVLTLTFDGDKVSGASFAAAQLDDTGVPVPAMGEVKAQIDAEWEEDRVCAGLAASPPG